MLAKAYLNSEQYDLCEQVSTYMNKTFPNDNSVQIVSLLFLTIKKKQTIIYFFIDKLDDGELFIT
jgi:hypothetical protein